MNKKKIFDEKTEKLWADLSPTFVKKTEKKKKVTDKSDNDVIMRKSNLVLMQLDAPTTPLGKKSSFENYCLSAHAVSPVTSPVKPSMNRSLSNPKNIPTNMTGNISTNIAGNNLGGVPTGDMGSSEEPLGALVGTVEKGLGAGAFPVRTDERKKIPAVLPAVTR